MENPIKVKVMKHVEMDPQTKEEKLTYAEIRKVLADGTLSNEPIYKIYPTAHKGSPLVQTFFNGTKYEKYSHLKNEEIIPYLFDQWSRGRVVVGNVLFAVGHAIIKNLTYKEVKRILRVERRAAKNNPDAPFAVRCAQPVVMPSYLKFDDFVLEAWNKGKKKRSYSYVTFSQQADKWLKKLIM